MLFQGHAYDFGGTDMSGLFILFDNVYRSPAWRLEGWVARTNLPVCTFMRAPGEKLPFLGDHTRFLF